MLLLKNVETVMLRWENWNLVSVETVRTQGAVTLNHSR